MKKKVSVTLKGHNVNLTEPQARSVMGQIASQVRINKRGGTGRPASGPRCPCGAMSVKRAAMRHHVCVAIQQTEETK